MNLAVENYPEYWRRIAPEQFTSSSPVPKMITNEQSSSVVELSFADKRNAVRSKILSAVKTTNNPFDGFSKPSMLNGGESVEEDIGKRMGLIQGEVEDCQFLSLSNLKWVIWQMLLCQSV